MSPTVKQIAAARRMFERHKKIGARHGAPSQHATWQEEMTWLALDPTNRRDVSEYLALYFDARRDAFMTVRTRP